jgi:MoaA/NifB/PqqE/SkfB family radical SAM enzyme
MFSIDYAGDVRSFVSGDVNFTFNQVTGYTETWGKTKEENPDYLVYGPMIADIEITTKCGGPRGKLCPFCYKGNTKEGKNMSFETFKTVFHKFPKTLTQIAFGADADLTSNPDIWKIMDYCRTNGFNYVVPNVTVADVSDEVADKLTAVCGAVAVSRYADKDVCYDSVKKLTDRGMKQVNIHIMISEQTYMDAIETITDIRTDPRLAGLNAIVFLSLKNKGRGKYFTKLSPENFNKLVYFSMMNNVGFGFDSCSCMKFLNAVKDLPNYKQLEEMAEPCESSRFSAYVNVEGNYFPCSFTEGTGEWKKGMSMIDCKDFSEIWNSELNKKFREKCVANIDKKIACQIYNV